MKKIYMFMAAAAIVSLTSCDLDLYPQTGYNEGNVDVLPSFLEPLGK